MIARLAAPRPLPGPGSPALSARSAAGLRAAPGLGQAGPVGCVLAAALVALLSGGVARAAVAPGWATGPGGEASAFAPGATPASALANNCAMIPGSPWRPKEFALLYDKGLFHVFYMRHDVYGTDDETEKDIGHAVSTDLVSWAQLPPVLAVRPGKWDSDHVWSPQVVQKDGVYYLFYTGVTNVPFTWTWFQRIGVATSTDLVNWTRFDDPVFTGNRVPWAVADSSQFDGCQFRDAFLMPDPTTPGAWLMYYVTVPASARGQLIVGVARSGASLMEWNDVGPMWATDAAHFWGWCESPMLMAHGGLWYLFANTTSGHPTSFRTATSPLADSSGWSFRYRLYDMVGQDPLSDEWFGTEFLSINGHDLLGYVNNHKLGLEFQEIVWGTPPYFTLSRPQVLDVTGRTPGAGVRLSVLGRAGYARGVVLRLSRPAAAAARLEIFDLSGRRVRRLHEGPSPAGESLAEWDGRDAGGAPVARGVYFCRLASPAGTAVARLAVSD